MRCESTPAFRPTGTDVNPAEIAAAVQAFQLLEPIVQQGIAALIHKAQKKQLTAQDYLDQAQAILNSKTS
jgi:hypothetical protein